MARRPQSTSPRFSRATDPAMTSFSPPPAVSPLPHHPLLLALRAAARAWALARRRQVRAARDRACRLGMRAMSDHELADIGICRGDLLLGPAAGDRWAQLFLAASAYDRDIGARWPSDRRSG